MINFISDQGEQGSTTEREILLAFSIASGPRNMAVPLAVYPCWSAGLTELQGTANS